MDIEESLQSIIGKERLEEEIDSKIRDFNGLLTRKVAIKMIAKEKNLIDDKDHDLKIKEIRPGMRRINLNIKVTRIFPEVRYISGKKSRSMYIEDESGTSLLKLWEKDTKLMNEIGLGDTIKIMKAYESKGELALGYGGSISVIKKDLYEWLDEFPENRTLNVRGIVKKVHGPGKHYSKDIFTFTISQSEGKEVECIIWEKPGRGGAMSEGDEVILDNVYSKGGKLNINNYTRILLKKNKGVLRGIVNEIKVDKEDECLEITIDDKRLKLNREKALGLMGIKAKEDIKLETIVNLKKSYMLNRSIAVAIATGE
ncbi:MAG: hypothetical protein ABII22_02675 [Candidatus Micrarchaeota archaeon]